MKTQLRLLFITLFVSLIIAVPLQAQISAPSVQSQVDHLSTLPESDGIVYFNASRILNEAVPRLLPEKELKEFRDGLVQLKAFTGVDLMNLEFLAITMRFNKPAEDTMFPIPDVMLIARGDFDAKVLIGMATMMSAGKLIEEKFGQHTIYTYSLVDKSKPASSNPFEAAFSEIAMTNLDANTLAVGNTSYIKAALEAADGHGRIKPEALASYVRNPNALISASGSPLVAFAKSFGLRMAENPDPNCMTKFGEYYISLTMGDNAFKFNGAMNADNPATARLIRNMLSGVIQEAKGMVPDKDAKVVFEQLKILAEGDEVLAELSVPQEVAARLVREMLKPAPKPAATPTKTVTKPKPRTRRTRN